MYVGDIPPGKHWTERREAWALQPNGELYIEIVTNGSSERARTVWATYRRTT